MLIFTKLRIKTAIMVRIELGPWLGVTLSSFVTQGFNINGMVFGPSVVKDLGNNVLSEGVGDHQRSTIEMIPAVNLSTVVQKNFHYTIMSKQRSNR